MLIDAVAVPSVSVSEMTSRLGVMQRENVEEVESETVVVVSVVVLPDVT